MTTQIASLTGPHSARSSGRSRAGEFHRSTAPVLIRVPSLSSSQSHQPLLPERPRVRRRLKKEVRLVAATLVFALPLSWGTFAFLGLGSGPVSELVSELAAVPMPRTVVSEQQANIEPLDEPRVTLTLRTADSFSPSPPPAPAAGVDNSIVLPTGFLVPDEAPEETNDAGH